MTQEDPELGILLQLAKHGQSHMYPLHEARAKPNLPPTEGSGRYVASRGTIHRAKRTLLKAELIKLEKKEKHAGRERKIYTLTIAGVIAVLAHAPIYKTTIDLLAKNYAHLFPLVFGKWDLFIKEKQRDAAIQRLIDTILFFQRNAPSHLIVKWTIDKHLKQLEKARSKWLEFESMTDVVYDFTSVFLVPFFFIPLPLPHPEKWPELREWFETINKDPDLKAFVDMLYKRKERTIKAQLESFLSWKKWWTELNG